RFGLLSIDDGVNELKKIGPRRRTLHRHYAHTVVSNNDLVAFTHIKELDGSGCPPLSVNGDGAIHHGGPHFEFLTVDTNESLLVSRHVKIGWKNAVHWSRGDLHILAFGNFGTMLSQAQDQFVKRFARFSGALDSGNAVAGAEN